MADRFGIGVDAPRGWHVEVSRQPGAEPPVVSPSGRTAVPPRAQGDVTRGVLHACTRPLPADRGDFGSGAVDLLGPDDIFVALVDYGAEVADQGLFERRGVPRLAPSQFAPNRLQRPLPGMSANQQFFSSGGRAFCLFTVLGSHARRMASVPRAARLVAGLRITGLEALQRQGGRP